MYQRLDESKRMTDVEVSVHYPDSYAVVRRDGANGETGTVLYVGDNMPELITLIVTQDEPYCGIVEGLNYQRSSSNFYSAQIP